MHTITVEIKDNIVIETLQNLEQNHLDTAIIRRKLFDYIRDADAQNPKKITTKKAGFRSFKLNKHKLLS